MNSGVAALAVGLVLGGLAGAGVMQWRADARMADLRAQHANEVARQAADAQALEAAARAKERRKALDLMEKVDAANLLAQDQRAAADRARTAGNELRAAYTTVAAALGRAAQDAPASTGGAPAAGAGLVLADVFGWCGARLQGCAAALDQSRTAGQLCEQAYDIAVPP